MKTEAEMKIKELRSSYTVFLNYFFHEKKLSLAESARRAGLVVAAEAAVLELELKAPRTKKGK